MKLVECVVIGSIVIFLAFMAGLFSRVLEVKSEVDSSLVSKYISFEYTLDKDNVDAVPVYQGMWRYAPNSRVDGDYETIKSGGLSGLVYKRRGDGVIEILSTIPIKNAVYKSPTREVDEKTISYADVLKIYNDQ